MIEGVTDNIFMQNYIYIKLLSLWNNVFAVNIII